MKLNNKETLYGIEILRFISAFAILVWHYQHFYFLNKSQFISENQPFYHYLKFFYTYGFQGVNFFWCISGFIFYWKYSSIMKTIDAKKFFLLRFARLYPLHFLTLILVTFLQLIYFSNEGNFFLNLNNDLFHFFLQFFMASYWGFEEGHSFNSPIWSISLEILVYFLFYFIVKNFASSNIANISMILICLGMKIAYEYNAHAFFDCALFFFVGGFIALNLNIFKKFRYLKILSLLAIIISLIVSLKYELTNINNFTYVFQLFSYPLVLLMFFNLQFKNDNVRKISNILGNLTYSSYLLHLPTQILIFILLPENLISDYAYNNYFFISYMFFILVISFISYKYFEDPMRVYIRNKIS